MRQLLFILTLLASTMLLTGCQNRVKDRTLVDTEHDQNEANCLIGNNTVISKQIPAPEYNSLSAHRSAEVRLVEPNRAQGKITVWADENVMPYVLITCKQGQLDITIDPALKRLGDCTFKVEVPKSETLHTIHATTAAEVECDALNLNHTLKLDASSAGEIRGLYVAPEIEGYVSSAAELEGELTAPKVRLEASSAGEIETHVHCQEMLKAYTSSAASIELRGEAAKCHLEASSGSELDAKEMPVIQGSANASSGASVSLYTLQSLKAEASSGGEIRYRAPHNNKQLKKSSGGSIKELKTE